MKSTILKLAFRKIPIVSPGLIFVQKAFLLGLFSEGLIIGRNFVFQNGLPSVTTRTASTDSPWAYIREGLLSERFVHLTFGGGGSAYFREGFKFIHFGGGGGLIIGILRSSWIYENVLSQNISTLTKILLNRALNKSNGPEST